MKNYVEMYCHNPECKGFNKMTERGYLPSNYYSPAEWVDEPECQYCYSTLREERFDIDTFLEKVYDALQPYENLYPRELKLLSAIYRAMEEFNEG